MEQFINSVEEYMILFAPLVAGLATFVALAVKVFFTVRGIKDDFKDRDRQNAVNNAKLEDRINELVRLNYEKDARITELLNEIKEERNEKTYRKRTHN